MKVLHQYEATDIDLKTNPVHTFMLQLYLVNALCRPQPDEDSELFVKKQIAEALNMAEKQGITIAKSEPVPAIFREEMK